ncbi:MAG: hypothetical protein JSV55_01760, partial [Deltaproteobacteria bacterium]
MVFTCQGHKSLHCQYVAEMVRGELSKIQLTVLQIAHMLEASKQGRGSSSNTNNGQLTTHNGRLTFWRLRIVLTGTAMKSFLKRLAEGRGSFRGLGMGETAALSLSKGMRRGQDSPVNK